MDEKIRTIRLRFQFRLQLISCFRLEMNSDKTLRPRPRLMQCQVESFMPSLHCLTLFIIDLYHVLQSTLMSLPVGLLWAIFIFLLIIVYHCLIIIDDHYLSQLSLFIIGSTLMSLPVGLLWAICIELLFGLSWLIDTCVSKVHF